MSRHREVAEAMYDKLESSQWRLFNNRNEGIEIIQSILSTEYGEGDVKPFAPPPEARAGEFNNITHWKSVDSPQKSEYNCHEFEPDFITESSALCKNCGRPEYNEIHNTPPQKQEAPLSAIEWIKKEGWDLRGIKSVKFMHKYSVDKEITPLELMHQYAHRIDVDKLAGEISSKLFQERGKLFRNTNLYEEIIVISQTIKDHLNR